MIEGVTLRPHYPEDQKFLLELFASSRERELEPVAWSAAEKKNFLSQQFLAQQTYYANHFPGREQQIVLLDGEPVGMQDVVKTDDELRLLDIILRCENRNVGLGSHLIGKILTEADEIVCPARLYVEKFNPAFSLYKRMQFSVIEDTGVHYQMERPPMKQETVLEKIGADDE